MVKPKKKKGENHVGKDQDTTNAHLKYDRFT